MEKLNNGMKELLKTGIGIDELINILKTDSVYNLLRFSVKSPSRSGMDDCNDDGYYDLYSIVEKLHAKPH